MVLTCLMMVFYTHLSQSPCLTAARRDLERAAEMIQSHQPTTRLRRFIIPACFRVSHSNQTTTVCLLPDGLKPQTNTHTWLHFYLIDITVTSKFLTLKR